MITRRNFIKAVGAAAVLASVPEGIVNAAQGGTKMTKAHPVAGTDGDHYIPFDERTGEASVVYFTRDLSAAGLAKMYDRIASALTGKIGVKLHTGEPHGPNIIPRPWVRELLASRLPDATIVETNTYYQGGRYTTEQHRKTIATNGWTFAPVDIMDEDGTTMMPVKGGKWFTEMSVGDHMPGYDSLLILTHFKGHTMGGFGGSNKNIGIGCVDGRIGKRMIHTHEGEGRWSVAEEELMERITESTKATVDHFAPHIAYVNVLRNMSVSCDYIRHATKDDWQALSAIEAASYPAAEGASAESIFGWLAHYPDHFWLLPFYAKFGFVDEGVSASVHGNALWHQMRLTLHE